MQKHYHQVIIEADLFMQELGKCCRDLFLNCRAEDYHKMTRPTDVIVILFCRKRQFLAEFIERLFG